MKPEIFRDLFGKRILLTKYAVWHILRRPDMEDSNPKIASALKHPVEIRRSSHKEDIFLYYGENGSRDNNEKYIVVVVKINNGRGYILTSFQAGVIKDGELIWKKK